MNKTYKIVNAITQKDICKFSADSNETIDLLSAVKYVGGILSDDKTEVSFNGGQSYIKLFDLYLIDYSRLAVTNSAEHIEKQGQTFSANDYQTKINKKTKIPKAGAIGAILIIAGVILFCLGITLKLPPKGLSYDNNSDSSYTVEEYVNGDAYNYLIAATQWAGEYSAKSTEKTLYICFGVALFSLGAVIGEIEWRKTIKENKAK